jgi:cell division protein FtsB
MHTAARLPLLILGRIFRSGSAVIGGLLVIYFALFAFEGDRGYANYRHMQQQVMVAESKLAEVQAEREAIERKVVALRPTSIDPDLLEEQARSELGFVREGDIVILGR